MTPTEAANTLGLLTAAWPGQDMPDRTVDLWIGFLVDLDVTDAKAAARTVIREDNWFPSVARFLEAAKAAQRGRQMRDAEVRGLPDGHRPTPPNPVLMNATRRMLAAQRAQHHDHRGPDPCPVCGGLPRPNPNRKAEEDG